MRSCSPGIEQVDAGVDEVLGVARRERRRVRTTDGSDLCVEGVDGVRGALSCCGDVPYSAAAASKASTWAGNAARTSAATCCSWVARRPAGNRERPTAGRRASHDGARHHTSRMSRPGCAPPKGLGGDERSNPVSIRRGLLSGSRLLSVGLGRRAGRASASRAVHRSGGQLGFN
jgi:hypothetical protein